MRRSRLFLLIAAGAMLLSLAALWQWRAHERDGSAALARGLAALDKGDARTARVELMNAIKGAPRSIEAHVAQARALVALEDGAGAQAEAERARSLGQAPRDTRLLMAQALLLQGDADGAMAEAGASDVPAGQGVEAMRLRARALLAKGDAGAARNLMDEALAQAPQDARTWIDTGRLRIAAGDLGGAILAADKAVALSPRDPKALALRGELTRGQYGLVAALPWFERALAIDPASVPVLEHYAATLADAGQAGRALSATRRLLAIAPGNARAWMTQAVIAARAGEDDLARRLLARTGGALDDEPATRLVRGVLHMKEGNAVLAADMLGPLVTAQPDNGMARSLLGRALYLAGDFPSAATILAPLVARRDASPYDLTLAARVQDAMGQGAMAADMLARATWPERAASDSFAAVDDAAVASRPAPADRASAPENIRYIRALLSTGRAEVALDRARLLQRSNPGAPDAAIALGDALAVNGDLAGAVNAYEHAANIRFDRAVAMRLAATWGRSGNSARALQIVQLFLSQNPVDMVANRAAAALAMDAGDWGRALRHLRAVQARLGSQDAVLMAEIARASLETGKAAEAKVHAVHAYRLMPGNPVMADRLGWVLVRARKDRVSAVDLLEKAVAMAPGVPLIQTHLGQAYAAAGRKQEAKLTLARALSYGAFAGRAEAAEALARL